MKKILFYPFPEKNSFYFARNNTANENFKEIYINDKNETELNFVKNRYGLFCYNEFVTFYLSNDVVFIFEGQNTKLNTFTEADRFFDYSEESLKKGKKLIIEEKNLFKAIKEVDKSYDPRGSFFINIDDLQKIAGDPENEYIDDPKKVKAMIMQRELRIK